MVRAQLGVSPLQPGTPAAHYRGDSRRGLLVGSVIALLFGVFDRFARNLLAYPFGIGFGLAAYCWFASYFPQTLAEISTAFECAPGRFDEIVRKWAQRLANRNALMVVAGAAIGASMLPNLLGFGPRRQILAGPPWVQSDAQHGFPFFALYYGFNDVVSRRLAVRQWRSRAAGHGFRDQ